VNAHGRRLSGLLVATLAALALLPFAVPVSASPIDPPGPGDATLGGDENRVHLEVSELTPRVVTAQTDDIVLRGRITNTGDRPISRIDVRLQLGERLRSPQAMQNALLSPPETEAGKSPFKPVARALQPGQSAGLAVRVPLGAAGGPGALPITERGVYPLLVNINGTPEYGGAARVGSLDMLLPVRSVPGRPSAPPRSPGQPPALTMLWPIADIPRRVGTQDDKQVLSDDRLATSLAPGGRLYDLVAAAGSATATDPRLGSSICYAVDPDLVDTVTKMTDGYRVRIKPGETRPGQGAGAAKAWLQRLRELTGGQCVLSLPYADADLVALARGGVVDLEKLAVNSSPVLKQELGVSPLRDVVWPASGSLDARSMSDLAGAGATSMVLDPGALSPTEAAGPLPIDGTPSGEARAIRLDRLVSTGFGGSSVERAMQTGQRPSSQTPADTRSVAVQNGLAAMLYRTEFAPSTDPRSGTMLIAPPRRWQAPASELHTLLDTAQSLIAQHDVRPVGLGELTQAPPALSSVNLDYQPATAAAEVPPAVIRRIAADNAKQRDLLGAMHRDSSTLREPADVVLPVQRALLRAASTAWRGTQRPKAFEAATNASNQLFGLSSQISVLAPNLPVSLASNESRLPVTVHNGLPVAVQVRIVLRNSPGLRTDKTVDRVVPPGGNRNAEISAQVLRPGRFTVDVALTTPGGTQLGNPARIQLSSTAYGTVTLVIAGTAFGLLLLLSGRRIYRRVRTARAAGGAAPIPPAAATGVSDWQETGKR
jgi:hypothetical protein